MRDFQACLATWRTGTSHVLGRTDCASRESRLLPQMRQRPICCRINLSRMRSNLEDVSQLRFELNPACHRNSRFFIVAVAKLWTGGSLFAFGIPPQLLDSDFFAVVNSLRYPDLLGRERG